MMNTTKISKTKTINGGNSMLKTARKKMQTIIGKRNISLIKKGVQGDTVVVGVMETKKVEGITKKKGTPIVIQSPDTMHIKHCHIDKALKLVCVNEKLKSMFYTKEARNFIQDFLQNYWMANELKVADASRVNRKAKTLTKADFV